ncbi:MAG: hypothetical protein AB7Q69_02805 [Gemmatimonadales bacterium]
MMMCRTPVVLALCSLAWVLPLPAQQRAESVAGLGTLTFPTSTPSAEAQTAFVRGVLLLHLFEYESATAAFEEAVRLDPGFAMAYWGEAMTATHPVWDQQDLERGRQALQKLGPDPAARAGRAPTPREKAWLGAIEILYGDGPKARRDTLYAGAMARLVHDYPGDDEARLFHALALLGLSQGVRQVPTYLRAAAIAESVFTRNPGHPGAAHYWIHGMDDPEHAAGVLPAARALSRIAPDAGHAQHMTSHIFLALGMWDDLVRANENALRVVDAARHTAGRDPVSCGHYVTWLEYGYLQQGRYAAARELLGRCMARAMAAPAPAGPDLDADNSSLASAIAMWSRYLLDTGRLSGEVAGWSIDPGAAPARRLTWAFVRAYRGFRTGDQSAAAAAQADYRLAVTDLQRASAEAPDQDPGMEEFGRRVRVLGLELDGLEQIAHGRRAAGLESLRRAAALEDSMAYAFGPPFLDKPPRELLGEELLAGSVAAGARQAFLEALSRTPRRTSALRGLARASEATGDTAAARRARTELETIWHDADPDVAKPAGGGGG